MTTPAAVRIPGRGYALHPGRLQLISAPTPNGVKVSILLEEAGLPYEAHWIDILAGETRTPAFRKLNPNAKIPVIIDPDGPGGVPMILSESAAILLYLATKTGRFLPGDPARYWETVQWLFFQMASIGPMFGQVGYFNRFAGRDMADKRPLQRYVDESRRLLEVLDERLRGRTWIIGDDYGLADIATLGWVDNLVTFYEARELVGFDDFAHVAAWWARGLSRPAVQRGMRIPARLAPVPSDRAGADQTTHAHRGHTVSGS